MPIIRTNPITGDEARSGLDDGDNMLSYIKNDITFTKWFHEQYYGMDWVNRPVRFP